MNETTTIRVSKKTAQTLEHMRETLNAQNLDETIQLLVKKQRKAVLEKGFGIARNQIKPFSEEDRGEDRN
jgi:DNA-binding MurR/RpiR family transcriptional regulator